VVHNMYTVIQRVTEQGQFQSTVRSSEHERVEPQGFFHCWNKMFCFKWKRVYRQLFHCSVFPNATCFIFCVVQWLHSGWWWQWNTKEQTYLLAHTSSKTTAWLPVFICRCSCRGQIYLIYYLVWICLYNLM